MELMPKELVAKFPKLGEMDGKDPSEVPVVAKFFNPTGAGTWFATEYDPEERMFFGFVNLIGDDCAELGYFSLNELESYHGLGGLGIERDLYFGQHTLREAMDFKVR